MDLPRSSTDLRIAVACPVCLGNGGFGSRTGDGGNPRQACTTCEGTGWNFKRPDQLTPTELSRLTSKLPPSNL